MHRTASKVRRYGGQDVFVPTTSLDHVKNNFQACIRYHFKFSVRKTMHDVHVSQLRKVVIARSPILNKCRNRTRKRYTVDSA